MTDTDLHHPDPGPLRAAAEAAELAQAASGLVSIDGRRLADSDPLAPLARDIARSLTEAGLTVHHWAQHDPLHWLGGVCVLSRMLHAFGYLATPFGSGGAWLVTGRRGTEAGQ